MVAGIGTDIIEVKRIEQAIQKYGVRFLNRLFTPSEQHYCQRYRDAHRHFAGRFAAKEAIVKALGTGIGREVHWLDIEIVNGPEGKPIVKLNEKLQALLAPQVLHLSISHCHEYAVAFVILE